MAYLLPDSRRFELHPTDAGLVRRGTVTADCLNELRGEAVAIPSEVIGRPWRVCLEGARGPPKKQCNQGQLHTD